MSTDERDKRAIEPIDAAHRERVEAGPADVRAGRFATEDDVEAAFARFRLGT